MERCRNDAAAEGAVDLDGEAKVLEGFDGDIAQPVGGVEGAVPMQISGRFGD